MHEKIRGYVMRRDKIIDIARGLSMVLIVLGHSGFPMVSYVYLFHVASFFIIAGWCWKDYYSDEIDGLKKFFKRKIQTLYFPYVAWMSFFTLFHNFFHKIHIYSQDVLFLEGDVGNSFGLVYLYDFYDFFTHEIRNVLFIGSEPLAGASWFLRCLFGVMVLWTVIDFALKKINPCSIHIMRLGIGIIFFLIGDCLRIKGVLLPENISTIFSVYILFLIGVYSRQIGEIQSIPFLNSKKYKYILVVVCIIILAIMNCMGNIDLSMNQYQNGLFLIACSLIGWIMLIEVALLIEKYQISRLFCFIGESTIWILFLHFAAFKFINVLQVYIYNLPVYRIASYPTLITDKGWWIIYTIVGVFIPLLVKQLVKKLRRCVQQFIMNNYVIHL